MHDVSHARTCGSRVSAPRINYTPQHINEWAADRRADISLRISADVRSQISSALATRWIAWRLPFSASHASIFHCFCAVRKHSVNSRYRQTA